MRTVDQEGEALAKTIQNKRTLRSEELFQGEREIVIEHLKEHYRLLITKAGKLILNK